MQQDRSLTCSDKTDRQARWEYTVRTKRRGGYAMIQHKPSTRWQDNPVRRVGPAQLLHTLRATIGGDHPDYMDYKARLEEAEARPPDPRLESDF